MKKFVSLCLVFMVIASLCSASLAATEPICMDEPFVIRSYIHYGMTKDEVIEAEEKNGLSKNGWSEEDEYGRINYEGITVAGISGVEIEYGFANNKLYYMMYEFPSYYEDRTTNHNQYTVLYGVLKNNYGAENWDSYLDVPSLVSLMGTYYNAASWIVRYNDCYVNPQIFEYSFMNSYHCDVAYIVGESQTLDEKFAIDMENEKTIQDSMKNDF